MFPLSLSDLNSRTSISVIRPSSPLDRKRSVDDYGEHNLAPNHRTGRWTSEEIAFTDEIVAHFDAGTLPLPNGMKLVDFLGSMLLSKPSRLTKKLKNAKLSTKSYKRTTGHVCYGAKNKPSEQSSNKSCKNSAPAASFSRLEDLFIKSLPDYSTTSEIKFMLTHNWRDWFSNMCFQMGQPLDAGDWLNSIEELDRRATMVRERALHAKRRMRMGYALQKDSTGSTVGSGVFISGFSGNSSSFAPMADVVQSGFGDGSAQAHSPSLFSSVTKSPVMGPEDFLNHDFFSNEEEEFLLNSFAGNTVSKDLAPRKIESTAKKHHSGGPYLDSIMAYLEKENLPFQYLDVWVPSYVAPEKTSSSDTPENELRLCYSGHAVRRSLAGTQLYTSLLEFGEYSSKFSFLQGHGLPGRVFNLGIPNWEQRVDHAPPGHFERCGGANLYGIKTVVGIPAESPSVGRIVLSLYSCEDIAKDHNMVAKICKDIARWNPLPKWKLVVDVSSDHVNENYENINAWGGSSELEMNNSSVTSRMETSTKAAAHQRNPSTTSSSRLHAELQSSMDDEQAMVKLLAEHMPLDSESSLPGFMSLRLLLLRSAARRTPSEAELVRTIKGSYQSYKAVGRSDSDIAQLLAKDCMFLMPSDSSPPSPSIFSAFNQGPPVKQNPLTMSPRIRNVSFSSASSMSPHGSLNLKESNLARLNPPHALPPMENVANPTLVSES